MIIARTAAFAAIFSLFLAAPSLAAGRKADATPCNGDGAFGSSYDPVAFHPNGSYLPDNRHIAANREQAAPDDGEDADNDPDEGDDPADDGDDANPDGCADIMVAPYDLILHPDDHAPFPVVWRRETSARRDQPI